MTLTLVGPDPAGPPALTNPPKVNDKPGKPTTDQCDALIFLSGDTAPAPVSPVGVRIIAAIAVLKARGWTPGTAADALCRTRGDAVAAIRNGPPARLHLVRTGEAA